jgi:PTH1 family peptidyl-tRNA hydrolase
MDNLFLISALGNPWEQYANTRHNAGRIMLDFIIEKLGLAPERQFDKKHQAYIWKTQISISENNKSLWGRNIPFWLYTLIFCKPQTYMNLSGQSVHSLIQYYKIPSTRLLVIHDDLDQALGEVKYKKQWGSGGQNGIKHISSKLNTEQYFRLKIGIGRPENANFSIIDWVLHTFSDIEKKVLYSLSEKCIHTIGLFLQGKS